jgi:outer membrane autotransporter protein
LRYGRIALDDFAEHGALGAMYIDGQSQESLKSALGLQASYAAQLGSAVLTPFARAQWEHEYRTSTPSIRAAFIPGDQFTVQGPHIGRDALLLDLGASAQITPRFGVFGYYSGELARRNYNVHSVTGGIRVSF